MAREQQLLQLLHQWNSAGPGLNNMFGPDKMLLIEQRIWIRMTLQSRMWMKISNYPSMTYNNAVLFFVYVFLMKFKNEEVWNVAV